MLVLACMFRIVKSNHNTSHLMDYLSQKNKTIIIKSKRKVSQISIENIIYISYDSYLLCINLNGQSEPEIVANSLKEIEEELLKYHFFKINRNEIINMKYFKSYHLHGQRKVTMQNGKTLKVSRRRWTAIKNIF